MLEPLTPLIEDAMVTWDMVTENSNDSKNTQYDLCINYQLKIGNFDLTLCLLEDDRSVRESFKIKDVQEKFSYVWESWQDLDEGFSLIQCDTEEDMEEKETYQQDESQSVRFLRDHLNIMRDLHFSDGTRTRSPSLGSSIYYDEDNYYLSSDDDTDYYSAKESESTKAKNDTIETKVIEVHENHSSNFVLGGCKLTSPNTYQSSSTSLGLSTPPTTPTSVNGIRINGVKIVKRRSGLLDFKLTSPCSPKITHNQGPSSFEVTIKIPSMTLKQLISSSINFQQQLPKISKELVPLAEMKKNPIYTLKNPQQNTVGNNIKHNLDYVKTLSKSKKDRYYSRLNIFELSKILDLDDFDISLTKEIEINILEIFKEYCNFNLGYRTWIRDTTKDERRRVIDLLYSYTSPVYPEFDRFKLEVIIRRGSYSLMQSRLRRDRRIGK